MNQIVINGTAYDIDAVTYPNPDKRFREAWNDPDADGVVTVNWAKYRTLWRDTASMDRATFSLKSHGQGWITATEAEEWAAGVGIPAIVTGVIGQLPEADRLPARIAVRKQEPINRTDRLIGMLMVAKEVSDTEMDAFFGYDGE